MLRNTLKTITLTKSFFTRELNKTLNLTKIESPLVVNPLTGLNDDLNGVEKPVTLKNNLQIVHSLAKWKRFALYKYGFKEGEGILTDMKAVRQDETLSPIHSLFVQQFDWEKVINKKVRNSDYLRSTVKDIFDVMKNTEKYLSEIAHIHPVLPTNIHIVTSQELEDKYPHLSPKERENKICEQEGAVFIQGIGGLLRSGSVHDSRAPDYDSFIDQLNGDILVWHPVLKQAFELSSMGIRVDKTMLIQQLTNHGCLHRMNLPFHKLILDGTLPQTIGGGIGQDRLSMFFLRKTHIGQVQVSTWENPQTDFL